MVTFRNTPHRYAASAAAVLFALLSHPVDSAPIIQGVAGTLDHQSAVTITGSGFGSKGTAAPAIWDDASGSNILTKWSGTYPSCGNSAYYTTYRAPQRGISLPHSHVTKYIAGAHGEQAFGTGSNGCGATGGPNVMIYKNRNITSYPAYTYASWYQRTDNAWVFGLGSPADDNYKTWDSSPGDLPYGANNWYLEYNARPTSASSSLAWHANELPDGDTSNWWFASAVNPMSGVWTKIEIEIKYSTARDGYVKIRENGVQKANYVGTTDPGLGASHTESIGGYARGYGNSNQWRYFSDVYLDYSRARVVLANNQNLSLATIIEPQIPTDWSDSSIRLNVNLGKFTSGTAYLHVVDPNGVSSSSGFPVSIGGTVNAPRPPDSVVVQ